MRPTPDGSPFEPGKRAGESPEATATLANGSGDSPGAIATTASGPGGAPNATATAATVPGDSPDAIAAVPSVVKELGRVPTDARRLRCALRPLLKLGKVKRDETRTRHTGMVRILWAQLDPFNVTWEQLNEMLVSLRVTRPNP